MHYKRLSILLTLFVVGTFFIKATPAQARCNLNDALDPFQVRSRDANGAILPGLNFIAVNQLADIDGNPYYGISTVASGITDAGGSSSPVPICVQKSLEPFMVYFYEYNGDYKTDLGPQRMLWDQLTREGDTIIAEVKMSYISVILRDAEGTVLKNAKFDIYKQSFDVNGNPIIDETKLNTAKLVHSNYTTGAVGQVRAYLGKGNYVIRIHGTGSTYFYLWNQVVTDGQATNVDYKLGTLRTVILDGYNAVIKDQAFSIYHQAYDVRGVPIFGSLIATLNTGSTGNADAYLPSGAYAIKVPGSYAGANYNIWNQQVSDQAMKVVNYRLSGFRIIISDDAGGLKKNSLFSIATQKKDALGQPIVDTTIINASTGETGYKDVYLTPGTYVMLYGLEKIYNLEVYESTFTQVDYPKKVQIRPRADVRIITSLANKNLTARIVAGPRITGLKNFKKIIGKTYVIRASKLVTSYTFTYLYSVGTLNKYNTTASKVRLAFYNLRTKKWSYVGTNTPARMLVSANLRDQGTITLVIVK